MSDITLKIGAEAEKIPGYLLWQVSRLWQRSLGAHLSDLGLSSTQAVILINVPRLGQENRTVTQALLAEVTKVDPMTLSQSIRTLERKGLVRRVVASGNKRAFHVDLTEAGQGLAMQSVKRIITAHQEFFNVLSDKTEVYVSLTQQLIAANNIMEGSNESNN